MEKTRKDGARTKRTRSGSKTSYKHKPRSGARGQGIKTRRIQYDSDGRYEELARRRELAALPAVGKFLAEHGALLRFPRRVIPSAATPATTTPFSSSSSASSSSASVSSSSDSDSSSSSCSSLSESAREDARMHDKSEFWTALLGCAPALLTWFQFSSQTSELRKRWPTHVMALIASYIPVTKRDLFQMVAVREESHNTTQSESRWRTCFLCGCLSGSVFHKRATGFYCSGVHPDYPESPHAPTMFCFPCRVYLEEQLFPRPPLSHPAHGCLLHHCPDHSSWDKCDSIWWCFEWGTMADVLDVPMLRHTQDGNYYESEWAMFLTKCFLDPQPEQPEQPEQPAASEQIPPK